MNKKIPMRTCIGCGENKPKKELVRIVKTSENDILVDVTGRVNGRGTYLCKDMECFEKCIKNKGFNKTFKTGDIKLSDEEVEKLRSSFEEALKLK